jgi:hypothetical protein
VGRQNDDYVKTFLDSVSPLGSGKAGYSFPVDLGDGIDPRVAPSQAFFSNIEKGPGGWYPLGLSRIPHGGVHLHLAAGAAVHAIADGDVIGFRAGEAEDAKKFGSRNFVLLRHKFGTKQYYSLYYHLAVEADPSKQPRWLQLVNLRAKQHVEATAPCPYFIIINEADSTGAMKPRLKARPQEGLAPGEMAEITASGIAANTLDDKAPADFTLAKLATPADTWVATSLDGKDLATVVAANASLQTKVTTHVPAGLSTPIRVFGGEVLGKIGKPPTDAKAAKFGTFVHVEVFSAESMMPGDGWTAVDVSDAASVPDRQAVVTKLIAANLIAPPPDKVLLATDVSVPQEDTFQELSRTAVVKMPSAWSLDWNANLPTPASMQFIDGAADIGTSYNEYRWWTELSGDSADLPASPVVFHFHPIGAMLAMLVGSP